MPELYETWWKGWKRQYPDYEFITWTDKDIPELTAVHQRILAADSMAKRSDIARYEILSRYGGIYLDCDIMPINRFDFARETENLIVCHERENENHNCQNAFIAVSQNHPIMRLAIETVCTIPAYRGDIILETGPGFFRRLLDVTTFKMLPTKAFYPYLFNQPFSSIFCKDLSGTYGVHVWGNSWLSLDMKSKKLTSMLHSGDIFEIRSSLAELPCDNEVRIVINNYIEKITTARRAIIDFARYELANGGLAATNNTFFDIFKTCYYLISNNSQAFIWYIGAGDGIANDKLRPIFINFDPPAILIEANLYAYHRLHQNYANNTRMSYVNAVFGCKTGKDNFFVLNLDIAEEMNLDPKLHHLSSTHTDTRSILGQTCCDPIAKAAIMRCLERTVIETINCEHLLKMPGIRVPDVIVIDIDSDVSDIIQDILRNGISPDILYFNTRNLSKPCANYISSLIKDRYEIVIFDGHSIAYRHEFYSSYCDVLLSDYGIATIFQRAMNCIIHPQEAQLTPRFRSNEESGDEAT